MAGLSQHGLEIRTQAELQALLEEAVDAAVPGVNVRAGPLQQLIGVLSEELAIAWETILALYAGMSEDAQGILLDQLAALTGTRRREATRSRVLATVNLAAGATLAPGAIAAVSGNPDAQFRSVDTVANASGSAADVSCLFEAVDTGPIAAPAGALTVIVTPVAGWNSVTNASSAELGRDRADDAELRVQRRIELAAGGTQSIAAVRAAVARVDEVLEVAVHENVTLVTDADGRPGKSIEAVVWDGSPAGADDDAIAQAIWDSKPAGIIPHGVGSNGVAIDEADVEHTVAFTRATAIAGVVVAQVVLAPGTAAGWEAQAIAAVVARGAEYRVGDDAYSSQLICALLEVPGIVAVTSLTINGGALVATSSRQIVRIDSADVTVSEA